MLDTSYGGIAAILARGDGVTYIVAVLLLSMSVATWYFIVWKGWRLWQMKRSAARFLTLFWDAPGMHSVIETIRVQGAHDPFARLAARGVEAASHPRRHAQRIADACNSDEFITRSLRRAIGAETARIESGLTVLASIGSTAPFVGLLGTVWGIYHALIGIGMKGQATLDAVAGPVGEALIMTAAGLAVAIPAVLAYNALVRSNRVLLAELDGFAHDVLAYLSTGVRLDSRASGAVSTTEFKTEVA